MTTGSPLPHLEGNPLLEARRRLGPLPAGHPDRDELTRRYAFGIPTEASLLSIATFSPTGVVELGAGTGYWARLLHDKGVDVVAYDLRPPPDNLFFPGSETWFPVSSGDESVVERHAQRTLLLVWPTWNEVWPGEAVRRYHAAGGLRVVFLGGGPGSGTGDSALHAILGDYGACLPCTLGVVDAPCLCGATPQWHLTLRTEVPSWDEIPDMCSVYGRGAGPERRGRRRRNGLFRRWASMSS